MTISSSRAPDSAPRSLIRDIEAADNLELMFVAAVATILAIRGFLHLTGYPQVGGGGLHIAHMLWGGLFMLGAIGLQLVFWNPAVRRASAFLAGVGWGTFIDELGKFITQDHNYFYKPTIALLYVLFVLSFLAVRAVRRSGPPASLERRVRDLLAGAGQPRVLDGGARGYFGLRGMLDAAYDRLVRRRWFAWALIGLAVLVAARDLALVAYYTIIAPQAPIELSPVTVSTLISTICLWIGIFRLGRSRLAAFRWFQRAILVSLLVTQIFLFGDTEFGALGGLVTDLVVYAALRYAIRREEGRESGTAAR